MVCACGRLCCSHELEVGLVPGVPEAMQACPPPPPQQSG